MTTELLFENILRENEMSQSFKELVVTFCLYLDNGDLNKELPEIKQRNWNTETMSYNEKDNTIYYNSDVLFLNNDILVKTFIAHECAHWAAGVKHKHDQIWRMFADELYDKFHNEIYEIYEYADDYNLDKIAAKIEKSKHGKLLDNLISKCPKLSEVKIKVEFPNDYPLEWDDENNIILVTPTLFKCDDSSYFSKNDKEIINEQLQYFEEEFKQ